MLLIKLGLVDLGLELLVLEVGFFELLLKPQARLVGLRPRWSGGVGGSYGSTWLLPEDVVLDQLRCGGPSRGVDVDYTLN